MPEFSPEESKVAVATFPVKPAGLACTVELWIGIDSVKFASSGAVPFVSTGADQSISLPIIMPGIEGTYHVYLDVFLNGQLIDAYRALEDVVIAVIGAAEFQYVSELRVGDFSVYRPDLDKFGRFWEWEVDVKNIGTIPGECRVTCYHRVKVWSAPPTWTGWGEIDKDWAYFPRTLLIQPGQTVTFSGVVSDTPQFSQELKIESEAGTIFSAEV